MKVKLRWFSLLVVLYCTLAFSYPAPYTCTRNVYVAKNGADVGGCGLAPETAACATIQGANDKIALQAGDCVNVAAGTYNVGRMHLSKGGNANNATGYVVYKGAPNLGTKLNANTAAFPFGGANIFVQFAHPFIAFDGFELAGNYFGNGTIAPGVNDIFMTLNNQATPTDHLMILNNLMHDSMGHCIALAQFGDYAIIAGNTCYNSTNFSTVHGSCISVWEPFSVGVNTNWPWDTQTFHIQILDNVVHDCIEKQSVAIYGPHTDGNGIILDTFDIHAYPFHVLVANNVAYHNGGRGIYDLGSNLGGGNTFANNIAYDNGQDPTQSGNGNCVDLCSNGDTWINNICYSTNVNGSIAITQYQNSGPPQCAGNTTTAWRNNLSFNGTPGQQSIQVTNNPPNDANYLASFQANNPLLGTNPQLVNVAAADFHPLPGSPVIGAGVAVPTGVLPVGTYPFTPDGIAFSSPPNIGAAPHDSSSSRP